MTVSHSVSDLYVSLKVFWVALVTLYSNNGMHVHYIRHAIIVSTSGDVWIRWYIQFGWINCHGKSVKYQVVKISILTLAGML